MCNFDHRSVFALPKNNNLSPSLIRKRVFDLRKRYVDRFVSELHNINCHISICRVRLSVSFSMI